jgi:hypothetical protein
MLMVLGGHGVLGHPTQEVKQAEVWELYHKEEVQK